MLLLWDLYLSLTRFNVNFLQVAALVPKGELEGEMGDAHMAMQARLMSQALRKLSHSLSLSQTLLIFINQVKRTLGVEICRKVPGFGNVNVSFLIFR